MVLSHFELLHAQLPSLSLNRALRIMLNNKTVHLCLVSNFSWIALKCHGTASEA